MASTLMNGARVPAGSDQFDTAADMTRLGQSIRTVLTANSQGEAVNLVGQARRDLGWTVDRLHPVYVWRTDTAQLTVWDGSRWLVPSATEEIDLQLQINRDWDVSVQSATRTGKIVNLFMTVRGKNAPWDIHGSTQWNIATVGASQYRSTSDVAGTFFSVADPHLRTNSTGLIYLQSYNATRFAAGVWQCHMSWPIA